MENTNEFSKQGKALRNYVFRRIGEELFAERRKRGNTLSFTAHQTNINEKFIDKAECGVGRSRWTILALLIKHYNKQLIITLTDIKNE